MNATTSRIGSQGPADGAGGSRPAAPRVRGTEHILLGLIREGEASQRRCSPT